ncbi:MAG: DUF58 domain-containing protein [Deltaproteobacteria bacterium]|nr:DUF58 domain-containing protein [Deltaproteobacteria bacterium]
MSEAPASIFPVFFVQAFMVVCLFFALLFDVAELILFSLIILAMGIGSYLWSRVSLNHVNCTITLNTTRLFPGEKLKIRIRAINSKLLPVLFKVDLFTNGSMTGSDTDQWLKEEICLYWFQQSVISRELFPDKRGVYNLGPPMLRGGDLFGFFFKNRAAEDRFEVVVYPRIVAILPISLPKREFFGLPGMHSPIEDPYHIFGTRDYQPGRPARRIHWKASARHNRLQEKLCEPARQKKILILLDVDQFENTQAEEDFEKSLEVIASLTLQLDRRGIAVGFATNGAISGNGSKLIPISRSPMQTASILEVLARTGAEKAGPVTDILSEGYKIPWGVSSIYFACKKCRQTRRARASMQYRNIPVRFVLAQKSNGDEITDNPQEQHTFYLENLLAPENKKG